MKNENSLYLLKEQLKTVLHASRDDIYSIQQQCVKENRFTFPEIVGILSGNTSFDDLSMQQLYWLFKYSSSIMKGLGEAEDYFTDSEVLQFQYYKTETPKPISFPLVFEDVVSLTPRLGSDCRQFSFVLEIAEIAKYKENNIIHVIPELQRGGKKNKYNDLQTKVNPKRVNEITELIASGRFFYNSISLVLIDDDDTDWYYDEQDKCLTVNSGTIIVPDGNHRAVACEFLDKENPHIEDRFHILFAILTPQETKCKIDQEWNTEPVSKSQQRYMKPTVANQIVDAIKRSPDIDDLIKKNIITSGSQIRAREGFIIYPVLSDAIKKNYDTEKMLTKQEQNKLTKWLVEFLNYIIYYFKEDFFDFPEKRKSKWNVSPYAFSGYIMFSRILWGDKDWESKLEKLLGQIDFMDAEFKASKTEKSHINYVEKIFHEVINNEYARDV